MAQKPVIVIAASVEFGAPSLEERYVLNKTYALAVIAGGGIPLLAVDKDSAADYAALFDGLVLTGAWPVHPDPVVPRLFPTREAKMAYTKNVRDLYDLALFTAFRDAGKPVLGICRGHQYISIG